MVKKTSVISVCPEIHFPSPSLLSMAVGFSPACRLIPTLSSVGFWLLGISRGWREVAGGAGWRCRGKVHTWQLFALNGFSSRGSISL